MEKYTEFRLPKGADQEFVLGVTDMADVAIDLSTFIEIFVFVYYKNGDILQQYKLGGEDGYQELTIGGSGNTEVSFKLQTEDTKFAKEGILFYELKTEMVDVSLGDELNDTIVTDMYLCTLVRSISSRFNEAGS